MAENKKGFVLYADQKCLFDKLPSDKAGDLIKHIFAYVNDEDPETDDLIVQIAFEPIKQQLKRDLKSYEKIKEKRSEAGKKGMDARWGNKKEEKQKITKDNKAIKPITKITVRDKDKVKDKVIDKDINNIISILDLVIDKFKLPKLDGSREENIKDCEDWIDELQNYIDSTESHQEAINLAKTVINHAVDDNYYCHRIARIADLRNSWVSIMKINLELDEKPTNGLDDLLPKMEFQEFWKDYPKRECLSEAQSTWNTVVKDNPEIIEKIKTAMKWQKKTGCLKERKYCPKPHDYLRGQRWEDEPSQKKANNRAM